METLSYRTRFLIIRHAQSVGNDEQKFQGRDNTALSPIGIRQARLLGKKLENEKIDAVYHSPLIRTRDTAQIAFGSRNIPNKPDDLLLPRDFGQLDGMKLEDAKRLFPLAEEVYAGRLSEIEMAGIEPIITLQERSLKAIKEISLRHKDETVATITHLFWIKGLLSKILDISFQELKTAMPEAWFLPATSVSVVEAKYANGNFHFEIIKVAESSHLGVDLQ